MIRTRGTPHAGPESALDMTSARMAANAARTGPVTYVPTASDVAIRMAPAMVERRKLEGWKKALKPSRFSLGCR